MFTIGKGSLGEIFQVRAKLKLFNTDDHGRLTAVR